MFSAEAGYAGLEPTEADNFDLSYEWYLDSSSSFTLGLFYKKLENAVAYGRAVRDIENNGSTQAVTIRGPSNDPSSAGTLKGFEIAYQTFFDSLPGAWAGLGVQLNYTHTDQDDINNSNLAVQAGYLPGSTTAFGGGNNGSTGGRAMPAIRCRSPAMSSTRTGSRASPTTRTTSLACTSSGNLARAWPTAGVRNS